MRAILVLLGLCFVPIGLYPLLYPHRVRNYVPSHEWQTNPEAATAKQELRARLVAIVIIVGVGGPLVVTGLVL